MDRRTELLDSAENAARRRGYTGFSYADLAEDVGIRKATIHYHFPTKLDLAVALLERYFDSLRAALDRISTTHDVAGAQLDAYLKYYRKALSGGDRVCLCVAFAVSRDSLSRPALKQLDAFHANSLAWLFKTFQLAENDNSVSDLSDAKSEAAALLALVEGAQLIARSSGKVSRFDQAVERFRSRLR